MNYLSIELRATKTNMLQSLQFLSAAPVLPTILAMHALDRKEKLSIRGVGLIHHNATPWIEYLEENTFLKNAIVQRRGAYLFDNVKEPQGNPMQPMALADLHWTILVEAEHRKDENAITSRLMMMRLAGGMIASVKIASHDDWDAALGSLRTGFWIEDVSDKIAEGLPKFGNPIMSFLAATRQGEWVVPANLGYALIETPRRKEGARDGKSHAFAEHLMGLVRYRSIHEVKKEELKPERLWRWGWHGTHQFLVTNRPEFRFSPTT